MSTLFMKTHTVEVPQWWWRRRHHISPSPHRTRTTMDKDSSLGPFEQCSLSSCDVPELLRCNEVIGTDSQDDDKALEVELDFFSEKFERWKTCADSCSSALNSNEKEERTILQQRSAGRAASCGPPQVLIASLCCSSPVQIRFLLV